MTESEALAKMVAPGTHRPGKYGSDKGFGGVIQIHVTRACDKACFHCTQGSNLGGKLSFMSVEQFRAAVESLRGYRGVVGVFGGNPALHPQFKELCKVLRESWVPKVQRGIWCNHPIKAENAEEMSRTFNPGVSNLNCHLDMRAFDLFTSHWPGSQPFGHRPNEDSRHSPVFVAMQDVLRTTCTQCNGTGFPTIDSFDRLCSKCEGSGQVYDEARAWELISKCDINQHWSAMIGVFRGKLRAWFCEIAGAQAMLHQDNPDYPDTGIPIPTDPRQLVGFNPDERVVTPTGEIGQGNLTHYFGAWWRLPMSEFKGQVRKHCHECGVPMKGYGALAQGSEETQVEQVSATHQSIYKPKRKDRRIELVTVESQLGDRLDMMTKYLQNARK